MRTISLGYRSLSKMSPRKVSLDPAPRSSRDCTIFPGGEECEQLSFY